MKKKGFVLMETIIVISVLCVILVILYGSYSKLIIDATKKSLYDNTEYIYKTNMVREYLEDPAHIPPGYNTSNYMVYCSNFISGKKCYEERISGDYRNELFKLLKVEAVYITVWNTNNISAKDLTSFEATTQNYIKTLDPTNETAFRLIVMYKSENDLYYDAESKVYQYASLRFGSRG